MDWHTQQCRLGSDWVKCSSASPGQQRALAAVMADVSQVASAIAQQQVEGCGVVLLWWSTPAWCTLDQIWNTVLAFPVQEGHGRLERARWRAGEIEIEKKKLLELVLLSLERNQRNLTTVLQYLQDSYRTDRDTLFTRLSSYKVGQRARGKYRLDKKKILLYKSSIAQK